MAEMSWENVPISDRDVRERIVRFLAAIAGVEYRPGMVGIYRRGVISLGIPAEAEAPAPAPASASAEAVLAALRAAGLIPAAAAAAAAPAAASAAPAPRKRGRPRKVQGGGQ